MEIQNTESGKKSQKRRTVQVQQALPILIPQKEDGVHMVLAYYSGTGCYEDLPTREIMLDIEVQALAEDLIMAHNLMAPLDTELEVLMKRVNALLFLAEDPLVILGNLTLNHRLKVVVVVRVITPPLLHVLVQEGLENKDIRY